MTALSSHFMQLCEGASDAERAALRLKPAKQFRYLSQSNCFDLRGVSNAEEYRRTRRSMSVVGIPEAEQVRILFVAKGLLVPGALCFDFEQLAAAARDCTLLLRRRHLHTTPIYMLALHCPAGRGVPHCCCRAAPRQCDVCGCWRRGGSCGGRR